MTVAAVTSDLWPYGRIGRLAIAAGSITGNETGLENQATSGLRDNEVASLGDSSKLVLDLQPQQAELAAFAGNATEATTRLTASANALDAMMSIAQSLSTGLLGVTASAGTERGTTVAALSASARADLQTIGTLLNTRVGDSYVFSGTASATAPIPDPRALSGGPFASSVAASLGTLSSVGAATVLQSILATAASTVAGATPFAAALAATPPQTTPIGAGQTVETGASLTATGGALQGTSGSTVRDLVAALTTISKLDTLDPNSAPFQALVSGLGSLTTGIESGLSTLTSNNGVAQQTVTAASAIGARMSDILGSRIGDLTSVDLASVSVRLTETQNQLQASYMLIKDLGALTLTSYL